MRKNKAFECGRAAFEALRKDVTWSRVGAQRKPGIGLLGTHIEQRVAVWVASEDLQTERADMPTLSALPGIRSSVYGVHFFPGNLTVHTSRFQCFCSGCKAWPRRQCSFPAFSQAQPHTFVPNRVKEVTKKQLAGFLSLQQPAVVLPKSALRAVYVQQAAACVTWANTEEKTAAERSPASLSQAVSRKVRAVLDDRAQQLQAEEDARLQEEHEARQKLLAAAAAELKLLMDEIGVGVVAQNGEEKKEEKKEERDREGRGGEENGGEENGGERGGRKEKRSAPESVLPPAKRRKRMSNSEAKEVLGKVQVGRTISSIWSNAWSQGTVSVVQKTQFKVRYSGEEDLYIISNRSFLQELMDGEAMLVEGGAGDDLES